LQERCNGATTHPVDATLANQEAGGRAVVMVATHLDSRAWSKDAREGRGGRAAPGEQGR
jgi:hypothetical protein